MSEREAGLGIGSDAGRGMFVGRPSDGREKESVQTMLHPIICVTGTGTVDIQWPDMSSPDIRPDMSGHVQTYPLETALSCPDVSRSVWTAVF